MFNKAFFSHVAAFGCCVAGYFLHIPIVFNMGVFALSGSLTNALAIHMLFEKVPGLVGSGVIVNRFEAFKKSIYDLVMEQFFQPENLKAFFESQADEFVHFDEIIEQVDLSPSFDAFVEVVLDSQLGSMLGMLGGAKILETYREPFLTKLQSEVKNIAHGDTFQSAVQSKMREAMDSHDIHAKVSTIVKNRLDELTPKMVKDLVAQLIKTHLGWLVVWGAVFGGLIGGVVSVINPGTC